MTTNRALLAAAQLLLLTALVGAQPAAPTGLTIEPPQGSDGQTELQLRWAPVKGAVGYEVYQLRGGRWIFDEEDNSRIPLTSSTLITGLSPSRSYSFKVRALDAEGNFSEFSPEVEGRTRERAASVIRSKGDSSSSGPVVRGSDPKAPPPPAPTGLFAVFSEQTVVKLSWRPSIGAAKYYIEEEKDGKWEPCEDADVVEEINYTEIPNHPTPGPYRFRIRAVGANGKSSPPSFPCTARR